MILNFALNYGARDELVQAARSMAQEAKEGQLDPTSIDAQVVLIT